VVLVRYCHSLAHIGQPSVGESSQALLYFLYFVLVFKVQQASALILQCSFPHLRNVSNKDPSPESALASTRFDVYLPGPPRSLQVLSVAHFIRPMITRSSL
jgi:hypothetical protein